MRVVWTARCLVCGWTTADGDVDLAARKHTGERGVKPTNHHPTVTEGTPA